MDGWRAFANWQGNLDGSLLLYRMPMHVHLSSSPLVSCGPINIVRTPIHAMEQNQSFHQTLKARGWLLNVSAGGEVGRLRVAL